MAFHLKIYFKISCMYLSPIVSKSGSENLLLHNFAMAASEIRFLLLTMDFSSDPFSFLNHSGSINHFWPSIYSVCSKN